MQILFKALMLFFLLNKNLFSVGIAAVALSEETTLGFNCVKFSPLSLEDSFFSPIIEGDQFLTEPSSFFSYDLLRSQTVTPASLIAICCESVYLQTKGDRRRNLGMMYAPLLVLESIENGLIFFEGQSLEDKANEIIEAHMIEKNLSEDEFYKIENLCELSKYITKKILSIKFSLNFELS